MSVSASSFKHVSEGPLIPALIGAIALGFLAWPERRDARRSEQPSEIAVSPELIAWLGGLRPGDELGGWRVSQIGAPKDGRVEVQVARGDLRFSASIARHGSVPRDPPVSSRRFALYYGHVFPQGAQLGNEWQPVLEALAKRLRENEDRLAPPQGL